MDIDNNETLCFFSNTSANGSTSFLHRAETVKIPKYVFTPAGITAKRVLCFILSTVGAVGFLGNCLVFFFLRQKSARNPVKTNRFVKNLNLYLRSLCLSDLLSCAISLPLLCIQILFDVFQSGWTCKMVRYLNFVFPVVTINNLVVISLEKYLSTRKIPRTFSSATVRKMIIFAWFLGISVMLFPAATYNGKRVDLNRTHFTVICKNNERFYPFRITLVIFPLQYVLPCIFVTYVNISLLKTLWGRGTRKIRNGVSDAFKGRLMATRIKGTILLVALTFAFIVPCLFYVGNIAYTQMSKPQRTFATDFIFRYGGGGIAAYFSSAINFIIYFVQMRDFRAYLKTVFCERRASRYGTTDKTQTAKICEMQLNLQFVNQITCHNKKTK